MLNVKDIINDIGQLVVRNANESHVLGNGFTITCRNIGFNKEKLEAYKPTLATILQELGIDEHFLIGLFSLTALKNGEIWNKLESLEDALALELLLACSDACGFIHNDVGTMQRNINQLGFSNSIFISEHGRESSGGDDRWLKNVRETVIGNMYFFTDPERIKLFAGGNQEKSKEKGHRHK